MDTITKGIKCGGCKGRHETKEQVRECCLGGQIIKAPEANLAARVALKATDAPATEKQVAFIVSLLADRVHTYDPEVINVPNGIAGSKRAASEFIKLLLECPKKDNGTQTTKAAQAGQPDVPAGYFAVASATGNNDLDFYRVDKPTEGRWTGYTFVKRIIGGQGMPQNIRREEAADALVRIDAAGPELAAALYGQEIGRCGKCNRVLTDEASRAAGLGPVCRAAGW